MTPHAPRGPVRLEECGLHAPDAEPRSHDRRELFVVEGESAALAVGRVRDATTQAVLPMQGKPLNALKASASKVASQPFFAALIDGLGAGWGGACNVSRLRYDRVLLLMDPDADGIHCGLLLIMFFYRWMQPLLDAGRVEIVRPPWGEVVPVDGGLPRYARSEEEFLGLAAQERRRGAAVARRFRGLAALEPRLLLEACVSPATRRADRIGTAEAAAMIRLFGAFEEASTGGVPPLRIP